MVGGKEVVGCNRSSRPSQSIGIGLRGDVGPEVVDIGVDVGSEDIDSGGGVDRDLDPQSGPQEDASLRGVGGEVYHNVIVNFCRETTVFAPCRLKLWILTE